MTTIKTDYQVFVKIHEKLVMLDIILDNGCFTCNICLLYYISKNVTQCLSAFITFNHSAKQSGTSHNVSI